MADQEMSPDRLSPRGLPGARRGYERKAVERLLEEARAGWAALQQEHRRLLSEIERAGGLEYLARDLGAVGSDVGRLLADAQETARGLRERAQVDSAERLAAAAAEAQRLVAQAEQQAYHVRADAWATGMELLRQAAETGRAMVEDAEAEVLIIRAGAEQEAHRLVAAARRESQDLVREARFAAERAALEARAQSEYVSPAEAAGPGPVAPTPSPPGPPAGRRRHGRPPEAAAGQTPDVIRVIQPPEGARPAARPSLDPGSYGDALAAEVEALWVSGEVEALPVTPEPPAPAGPAEPEPEAGEVPTTEPPAVEVSLEGLVEVAEAEAEVAVEAAPEVEAAAEEAAPETLAPEEARPTEVEAAAAPEVVPPPPSPPSGEEPVVEPESGAVEELFARLRDTHRPAGGRRRRAAPPAGETLPGLGPPPLPGIISTARGPKPDAVELRERLVLPVQNRALRRVKETLLELQNSALDTLRVSGTWEGAEPSLAALAPALDPVAEEAAEAGVRAVAAFTGGEPPAPVIGGRSATLVQAMADELAAQVASALADATGAGPLEVAAAVSRVFRAWRGEEAEHWVRTVAYAAYHDSLLAGLAVAGVESVAAVAHGLLCPECPALQGVPWDPAGPPPPGTVCPPAHPNCVCTVAPTAAP